MRKLARGSVLFGGVLAICLGSAAAARPSPSEAAAQQDLGRRVRGFVVWESNRSGHWELYRIETDGSGFRQLTDFQKLTRRLSYGKYLRPRVSPDGKTILFGYALKREPVGVWLVPAAGGDARKLTGGNPLNWAAGGREVLFVRDHHLWRHELATGRESLVHKTRVPPPGNNGSMVGQIRPDLKAGIFRTNRNEYFLFERGKTVKTTGGCEPRFSADGRYMYWVGGPKNFRVWEIARDREWQFFGKPPVEPFNYTYFPTVSGDGRWLAYGASPAQHNHNTSDYEIFLQELNAWKPTGKPVRLSWHPRTDRWPFLHVYGGGGKTPPAAPVVVAAPENRPQATKPTAAAPHLPRPPRPNGSGDALEIGGPWKPAWGNRVALSEVTVGGGQEGPARLLSLACSGGSRDKAAVSRPVKMSLARPGRAALDLFALGTEPARVAVAVFVTGERVYYESVLKRAQPGVWTRLEFDLGSADWKCQATKWRHTASIAARDDVREVILLVYNGKRDRTVYVDNLRFY